MKSLGILLISAMLFTAILAMSASAITGKIGNARAVLYPEVGFWGTTIDRTIYVENVNDVPVNVTLDAGNSTLIKIIDKTFVLQPGENKDAAFTINIKKAGNYTEKLNIFFAPLNKSNAGIALSANYIIHAGDSTDSSDNSNSDNSNSDSSVTNSSTMISGNVVKLKNLVKENGAVAAVSASTLILAVLLLVLVYLGKKNRGKVKLKRVNDRKV